MSESQQQQQLNGGLVVPSWLSQYLLVAALATGGGALGNVVTATDTRVIELQLKQLEASVERYHTQVERLGTELERRIDELERKEAARRGRETL